MPYRAWDLFSDRTYQREVAAWQEAEDLLEQDEVERDKREALTFADPSPGLLPLLRKGS